MSSLPRLLMNSGSSGERRFGRALARGRVRIPSEVMLALDYANRLAKDGDGAMTSSDTFTPTAGRTPGNPTPSQNKRRATRLKSPYVDAG